MEGICCICGEYKKLTFEHIPPKSAFNDRSVVLHKIEDIMCKAPNDFGRGRISQKGSGEYTLCSKCNNDTGAWYGDAFAEFAEQGMNFMSISNSSSSLYYPFHIYPLRVLKQIL